MTKEEEVYAVMSGLHFCPICREYKGKGEEGQIWAYVCWDCLFTKHRGINLTDYPEQIWND